MPDWLITSTSNANWQVWLANCSQEHADSVVAAIGEDPHCPNDLTLEESTYPVDPADADSPWYAFWRS